MKCNGIWLCTPNARLPPILLLCDVVVTHLPQRRVIRHAQRGQSQPVADQSVAEWDQSQPGTEQSAAGSQTSLLDQGAVNVMATVPPESKLQYGVMRMKWCGSYSPEKRYLF